MRKKLMALLAGAMLMMAAGSAWAIPILSLNDGTNSRIVIDGTGTNTTIGTTITTYDGTLDGLVSYIGTVGTNWTVNVSSGLINANPGVPSMALNTMDKTSTGAGNLTVTFSDLITSPWTGLGATTHAGGVLASGPGNSVKFETKINNTSYSTMTFASPVVAFSEDKAFSYTPTGNDFIEMIATLHHNGTGTSALGYEINPVPEPGTMVLLGAGLLGLAIFGKRRMNKEA